ncbi:MAG: hypothetical protein K5901_07545, partial [Bacteroidales bacterium]|nr:hypothetical protein [Bacteroidales bacterium]
DMVRLGIGVYGVAVVDEDRGKLHNVMSLKSTIKQIKEYGPGETIRVQVPYSEDIINTIQTITVDPCRTVL